MLPVVFSSDTWAQRWHWQHPARRRNLFHTIIVEAERVRTDASFVRLTHKRGMAVVVCQAKTAKPLRCTASGSEQRQRSKTPVEPRQVDRWSRPRHPRVEIKCHRETRRECFLPSGNVSAACAREGGRSSEVSPSHVVTKPPGPRTRFLLRQMSEEHHHRQGRRAAPTPPVTASRSITSHLHPPLPFLFFFSFPLHSPLCFSQAAGFPLLI